MKRFITIILSSLFCISLVAQSPNLINYQSIMRDGNGNVLAEKNVALKFSILKGSENGTAVYTEQHLKQTNAFGLVNLKIGDGVSSDDMSAIDWGSDEHYLKVELDPEAGSNYQLMGTSQIVSTPYALHAETVSTLMDGSVTKNKIADEAIDSTKIKNIKRNISFNSAAIYESPELSVINRQGGGLDWQAKFNEGASIRLIKPADYAGGDVVLSILFQASGDISGIVSFFTRPRSYNSGDSFSDVSSISSSGVAVAPQGGFGNVYVQEFVLPASRFEKDWWYISLQRGGTDETYAANVVVYSVDLEYMAQQ